MNEGPRARFNAGRDLLNRTQNENGDGLHVKLNVSRLLKDYGEDLIEITAVNGEFPNYVMEWTQEEIEGSLRLRKQEATERSKRIEALKAELAAYDNGLK